MTIPRPPLVGRQRELERIEGLQQRTESERRALGVVVTGGAGVGKTRLVEEAIAPWQRRSPARDYAGAARGAAGQLGPVAAMLRGRFGPAPGSLPVIEVSLVPLNAYDVLAAVHAVEPASSLPVIA